MATIATSAWKDGFVKYSASGIKLADENGLSRTTRNVLKSF